jgi:NAD(P)-dependent dehydrogenase (short-subunit alcohol dehydrogenase family)
VPERVAVVTGGAGAIGTSTATALRETGHRTVILDRAVTLGADGGLVMR